MDTEDECDKKGKGRKGPVLLHAEDVCAKVLCDSVVRIGQMCYIKSCLVSGENVLTPVGEDSCKNVLTVGTVAKYVLVVRTVVKMSQLLLVRTVVKVS